MNEANGKVFRRLGLGIFPGLLKSVQGGMTGENKKARPRTKRAFLRSQKSLINDSD